MNRDLASTGRIELALKKVPEVTLLFWVMKMLATTLGETAGDLLVVGVYWLNSNREAALAQARLETQGVREFTNWVKAQPEGKRLYDRYYNP